MTTSTIGKPLYRALIRADEGEAPWAVSQAMESFARELVRATDRIYGDLSVKCVWQQGFYEVTCWRLL